MFIILIEHAFLDSNRQSGFSDFTSEVGAAVLAWIIQPIQRQEIWRSYKNTQ